MNAARLLCTACGRRLVRVSGLSTVATTVHTRTCQCGARFRIVARPVRRNNRMTIHVCNLSPLKPRRRA
jgi:hypothetical protein